jgi:hypothetical protein
MQGMLDDQLDHLARVLKLKRIWAVNVVRPACLQIQSGYH